MLPSTAPYRWCCHWNFDARQVHGGSSEDHTSRQDCAFSRMVQQDHFVSGWSLTVICMRYGLEGKPLAHWQHAIFGNKSRFQRHPVDGRLRVCSLHDERSQECYQAYNIQVDGGLAPVWVAFRSGAKAPPVLPDIHLTSELYSVILQNTLVPFARQHFGDNYCYQDGNATPYRARIVLEFPQQGDVTKMEQPARSPQPHRT